MGIRGPKGNHYEHKGVVIAGLRRDPKSKRFYPVGKGSPAFGTDPSLAIHKFQRWQQAQGIEEPFDPFAARSDLGSLVDNEREKIRNLILHHPSDAALYMDLPFLAHYPQEPEAPMITLEELGERYVNEKRNKRTKKPLTPQEKRHSRQYWTEFVDICNVRFVKQITDQMVTEYNKAIMAAFDDGMSPTYVIHRFGTVKAILSFGAKEKLDRAECERVLSECKGLEPPQSLAADPHPISRKNVCEKRWHPGRSW